MIARVLGAGSSRGFHENIRAGLRMNLGTSLRRNMKHDFENTFADNKDMARGLGSHKRRLPTLSLWPCLA